MATASAADDPRPPTSQQRLASGEPIFPRWPNSGLADGMLAAQIWLRGEPGAMRREERPAAWNGEAAWWPPGGDRRAALRSLLPDLLAWLPPGLEAPNKLQIADRMAVPARPPSDDSWDYEDPAADRPFIDAVFVDDAAHLHLVDVAAVATEKTVLGTFVGWNGILKFRDLQRHWLHRSDPGTRFSGEYGKLSWLRRRPPIRDLCALLDSRGDEMPDRTAEAFWQAVGRRCLTYWERDLPSGERDSPHCVLVTDGAMPPDDELLELHPEGSTTLACVTPFLLDGDKWLRVEARGWVDYGARGGIGEMISLAPNRSCRMAGATDVGKRREANQDALLWRQEDGWAAVADGMGGHPNGDVASATVLQVFEEAMAQWPGADAPHRRRTVAGRLRRAAAKAHAALWQENAGAGIFSRMGTTLSALRLHGDQLSFVHAGDSRIYEYKRPLTFSGRYKLRQLTADHGEGGGLDRALGLWERIPFDIDTVSVPGEALYLLCTDGLTNMVDDAEILRLCQEHDRQGGEDLEGLVAALIDAANEAGGADNITVCAVAVRERS